MNQWCWRLEREPLGPWPQPLAASTIDSQQETDKRMGMTMNNLMACITDSDEHRFEPDLIDLDEAEDPRTEAEKRLEWLCDEWVEAQADDCYETWRDIRMTAHGAFQALNFCTRDARHEDRMALMTLGSVAFEHSLACIAEDKYEGVTK